MMTTHPSNCRPTARRVSVILDTQYLYLILRGKGIGINNFDWESFFRSVLIGKGDHIERVVWFRTALIEGRLSKQQFFQKWIRRHYPEQSQAYLSLLQRRSLPNEIYTKALSAYRSADRWLAEVEKQFTEIEARYSRLVKRYPCIELVNAGFLRVDMLNQEVLGEKGIDVGIGVYMTKLAYTDACDSMVLLSGDLDFIEALKTVQSLEKQVSLVRFEGDTGLSSTLSLQANEVIPVRNSDLKRFVHKPTDSRIVQMPFAAAMAA